MAKLFKKSTPDENAEVTGVQGTTGSVEELVPVQSVFDNMMVLKDGSFRMLLKTTALNFDLKSPPEQRMILNTWGSTLNALSIDFPIQVMLHATHLDTQRYSERYRERLRDPKMSSHMKAVIEEHLEYFEYQARTNFLLDRSFYIVIPFFGANRSNSLADTGFSSEMPGGGLLRALLDGSEKEKTKQISARELEIARVQLMNRASMLISQLSRVSITGTILTQLEMVQLLREMYNPGISEKQKLRNLDDVGSLIALPSARGQRARYVGGE